MMPSRATVVGICAVVALSACGGGTRTPGSGAASGASNPTTPVTVTETGSDRKSVV